MPHLSLQRRLRRLQRINEASSDGSGFAPHSPEWLRFWLRWAAQRFAGEHREPPCMTIEAFRALIALDQTEPLDDFQDIEQQ